MDHLCPGECHFDGLAVGYFLKSFGVVEPLRISIQESGYILPHDKFFRVQNVCKKRPGIIGALPAEGGGHPGNGASNESLGDKDIPVTEIEDAFYSCRAFAPEDIRITVSVVGYQVSPDIYPFGIQIRLSKEFGDNDSGPYLPVRYNLVIIKIIALFFRRLKIFSQQCK